VRLWVRSRHIPYLAATVVAVGVLQVLLAGRVVLTPPIVGTASVSPWSMFLPVVAGVAVADAMASKTQGVEARIGTHVVVLDVALLFSTVGLVSVVLILLGGTHPALAGTVGQVAAAAGAAATATLRWGAGTGALLPVAMAITCLGYGLDAPGGAFVRVLAPDSSPWWDLLVGGLLLGLAVLTIATRSVEVRLRATDRLID
jgi:hypothetical protein